jgi:hypothetical protein
LCGTLRGASSLGRMQRRGTPWFAKEHPIVIMLAVLVALLCPSPAYGKADHKGDVVTVKTAGRLGHIVHVKAGTPVRIVRPIVAPRALSQRRPQRGRGRARTLEPCACRVGGPGSGSSRGVCGTPRSPFPSSVASPSSQSNDRGDAPQETTPHGFGLSQCLVHRSRRSLAHRYARHYRLARTPRFSRSDFISLLTVRIVKYNR